MLFALVVMAGVVLLIAVFNNRREPSWWDRRRPRRKGRSPEMAQRGHSAGDTAATRVLTVALTRAVGVATGAVVVEAEAGLLRAA